MNHSKITTSCIIKRFSEIDNSYDYSIVEYNNMHCKVKVICSKHGIFEQTPNNILNGFFCKKCKRDKKKKEKLNILIDKCNYIHNKKYNYNLVEYDKMIIPVNIICPIHGIFKQTLNNHINNKKGCPKCVKNYKLTQNDFIIKSNNIHDNFYNYTKSDFINVATKVIIICPIHGEFKQTPNNHLNGIGCPNCNTSKGETNICKLLTKLNISYTRQQTFKDCKCKRCLPFDFYLPDYNVCIEYDGIQHFKPIEKWGGRKNFLIIKKHDNIKNEYCINNNINLIRISYTDNINEKINNFLIKNNNNNVWENTIN